VSKMRLAQVIVIVVALAATPLALLARGIACDNSGAMCCMMHSQHSGKGMMCEGSSGNMSQCPMRSGHRPLDFGFIAPIAPTYPMPITTLIVPGATRQPVASYGRHPVLGFLSAPFEPPRS
jgi:hypothetical protein